MVLFIQTDTHDDHIAGVSVWVPPKRNITSIFKFIENGGLKIPIATIYRLKKLSDFSAKIHKECIQKPHWYLFINRRTTSFKITRFWNIFITAYVKIFK